MSTPFGEIAVLGNVCRSYEVNLDSRIFLVDLISLEMKDFDVILEIDLLMKHLVSVDCFRKRIVLAMSGQYEFFFSFKEIGKGLISILSLPFRLTKF